jgi:hypothetical protein
MAADPNNPSVMYVGNHSLYRTDNGGDTWAAANFGMNIAYGTILSVLVDPADSNVVYAA